MICEKSYVFPFLPLKRTQTDSPFLYQSSDTMFLRLRYHLTVGPELKAFPLKALSHQMIDNKKNKYKYKSFEILIVCLENNFIEKQLKIV